MPSSVSPLYPPPPGSLTRSIRLGVIGAGWIAQSSHLPALAMLRQWGWPITLDAIADPKQENRDRARSIVMTSGLSDASFQEYNAGEALLAAGGIDAVLLLTPPVATAALLQITLARKIPVLAEKPVTHDAEILGHLVQAEKNSGTYNTYVAYNRRSQPLASPFRSQLRTMREGTVSGALHVEARLWRAQRADSEFYDDTMIHALDFLLWCLGPLKVQRVDAWSACAPDPLSAGLRVALKTDEGVLPPVTAHLDVRPAIGRDCETYVVLGAARTLELEYPSGDDPARLTLYGNSRPTIFADPDVRADDPGKLAMRGFLPQLAAFLRPIIEGSSPIAELPLCTLAEAYRSMALRDAVLRQTQPDA